MTNKNEMIFINKILNTELTIRKTAKQFGLRRDDLIRRMEEAAEIIRTAANTDINTIFGAVINENLNDEVIVTVIATGFEQPSEPLYHNFNNSTPKEEVSYRSSRSDVDIDNDLDIPPFLRDRDEY